jgi:glycosyltransferase involved in cell wall biosynthesis
MPAISVLLPVRDAAPWLAASLSSLWRQTFADFEVVAVDDGSTDGSGEMLERAARRESRLAVIRTPARGLPRALETARAHASATLIARHDADDLSHRERFALQRAFLLAHPPVAVVGCRLRLFPGAHAGAGMRRWAAWHDGLITHEAMAEEALVDSPLAHGTALIRASWIERVGGWRERGWPEDVDLWLRLLRRGARFAKLPRTLYGWRQHPGSATRHDPRYAAARFMDLREDALARTLLRRRARVTLVGVGISAATWQARLEARLGVRRVEAGRPSPRALAALDPPVVLVFGAAPARARWRAALRARGLVERTHFVFTA